MADEIDITTERIEHSVNFTVEALRRRAEQMPKGREGYCDFCGEHFARVVVVLDPITRENVESCGRCRDRRGIE